MIRGVPYDAEVEYLESTGTQWIDTGVVVSSVDYIFSFSVMPMASSQYVLFGLTRDSSGYPGVMVNDVGSFRYGTQQSQSISPQFAQGVRYDCALKNKELTVNSISHAATGTTLTTMAQYSLYIFARNNWGNAGNLSKSRFYNFSISTGGVIVRDFIPVRVGSGSSAVGYMYDRVTRKLFGNQGTGSFVIGPDVATPVMGLHFMKPNYSAKDYVQDGLIAMWDGIENAGWGVHNSVATTWKDLIGNRDWTLGTATSYEWTANSFNAKDQFAATQDFIDGSLVTTVEVCAKIVPQTTGYANYALIIIGRDATVAAPYYGLLYRKQPAAGNDLALMCGRSYFDRAYAEFGGVPATFSFPQYYIAGVSAYFNGAPRAASGSNTLDYNADTRGAKARIGGILTQAMPIEVFNLRLYSRALTAAEIAANYAVDKARFNLPEVTA